MKKILIIPFLLLAVELFAQTTGRLPYYRVRQTYSGDTIESTISNDTAKYRTNMNSFDFNKPISVNGSTVGGVSSGAFLKAVGGSLVPYANQGEAPAGAFYYDNGVAIDTVLKVKALKLDTTAATPVYKKGTRYWDTENNTTTLQVGGGVNLQDGQELHLYCQNNSGVLIGNGKAVYIVDAGGETPRIRLASNATINTAYRFIGITTQDIPHGSSGVVAVYGKVHDLNTNGMTEGSEVYLTTSGNWSQTKPTSAHIIKLGVVTYAHSSNGIVLVSPDYCTQPAFKILNNNATSGIALDTIKFKTFNGSGDSTIIDSDGQRFYKGGTLVSKIKQDSINIYNGGTFNAINSETEYSSLSYEFLSFNTGGVNSEYSATSITNFIDATHYNYITGDRIILRSNNDTLKLLPGSVKIKNNVSSTTLDTIHGVALTGNATVWKDLNFSPNSTGNPSTVPDYVSINNTAHREFTSANNQSCGDTKELDHDYKLSSNLTPHAHIFLKSGESAGTTGVTFTFYWELRQTTGTTSGSVTLSATSAQLTANPEKYDITSTAFAGSTELGGQLSVTIARTGGDAGDVVLLTYGVHYESDSMGSQAITTK